MKSLEKWLPKVFYAACAAMGIIVVAKSLIPYIYR